MKLRKELFNLVDEHNLSIVYDTNSFTISKVLEHHNDDKFCLPLMSKKAEKLIQIHCKTHDPVGIRDYKLDVLLGKLNNNIKTFGNQVPIDLYEEALKNIYIL